MKKWRKGKGNPPTYGQRNALLVRLGYKTYSDYLQSDLWRGIRAKGFKEHGTACRLCEAETDTLHHISYGEDVLLGANLQQLVPLCRTCHTLVEVRDNGKKRDLESAQRFYRHLTNNSGKKQDKLPKLDGKCVSCRSQAQRGTPYCRPCRRKLKPPTVKPVEPILIVGGTLLLTKAMYYAGRSRNGGWSKGQQQALGFRWGSGGTPIGTYVSLEGYEKFMQLKNAHLPSVHKKK